MNKIKNLYYKRQECPVCQSSKFLILLSKAAKELEFIEFIKLEKFYSKKFWNDYENGLLDNFIFEILKCKTCNFVFQREILKNEGMSLLYNQWLDQEKLLAYYADMKMEKSQIYWPQIIKGYFKNKSSINAMDFGAGYGNFCKILINTGFKTYAFDLSDDKNNHLSSIGVNVINNLTDYDSFFDFIYVNQVFEHVENPLEILKNLQRTLSDKGLIFIAVPDCKKIEKIIKDKGLSNDLFLLLSPQQHINAFSNNTLRLIGREANLKEFRMTDFLKLHSWSLSKNETILLSKATIKSILGMSTSMFFHK